MITAAPTSKHPLHGPFTDPGGVRCVRIRPVLLEHPADEQATLNRGELGVTVQFHGFSLELEASAPPVSKETRTYQRHWELQLGRRRFRSAPWFGAEPPHGRVAHEASRFALCPVPARGVVTLVHFALGEHQPLLLFRGHTSARRGG